MVWSASDISIDEARDRLEGALAAEPRFADAYSLLARLYMEQRTAWADDWPQRAAAFLKRVLELRPNCPRTAVLLGTLYADPFVGRYIDAEPLFRQASDQKEACLQLARLIIASPDGRTDSLEALDWLCQYVALSGGLCVEADRLLDYLLLRDEAPAPRDEPPAPRAGQRWTRMLGVLVQLEHHAEEVAAAERIRNAIRRVQLAAERHDPMGRAASAGH
jgi:tetratricopeptide (TPR) repeat protein